MNKTELIGAVAQEAEMTKKDAEKAVKAVIDVVSKTLEKGEKVQLLGNTPCRALGSRNLNSFLCCRVMTFTSFTLANFKSTETG